VDTVRYLSFLPTLLFSVCPTFSTETNPIGCALEAEVGNESPRIILQAYVSVD